MNIEFTVEEYFNELQLMESQYGQEEEVYPWVYMLLQMVESRKKDILQENYNELSIRLVAHAPSAESIPGRQLLGGEKIESRISLSFPDIAILNNNFSAKYSLPINQLNYIYGCIECKKIKSKFPILVSGKYTISKNAAGRLTVCKKVASPKPSYKEDLSQLLGELLWYGKVLYTDGLVWKYFKITNLTNNSSQRLDIRSLREKIFKEKNFSFENLLVEIELKEIANLTNFYFNNHKASTHERLSTYAEWNRLIWSLASIDWQQDPTTIKDKH